MQTKIKGISISTRITVMVLFMVILSSVAIGVFSYVVYRNDSIRYQGQRALAAAAAIASVVDVEQFKHISVTEERSDYYYRMQEIFTAANKNVGTLYLYSMIKDDDGVNYKYVFAAETDLGNPTLGGKDTIESYGEFALRAYDSGEQVISDIYNNEGYGFLVSAFYPLYDQSGNFAGLVCADINADKAIANINDYRDKVIFAVLAFVLIFGFVSVTYSLHLFEMAKLAEQKARKLAAIVAMADAGIIVKDKTGVVTEWNIGAENLLGYTPEEIIGRTTHSYAPSEFYQSVDEVEARLESGEHIVHVEVERKHKDGRLVCCSVSYTPILDSAGKFNGSVAIFHDITDKKQMELALQSAHRTILSSIEYSSKIQRNLLPPLTAFEQAFSDYSIIWKPRDIVGGDIYWLRNFDDGALLCVCDCTGHGTPGALLTMLVVSALDSIVNEKNYKDTANVLWDLDKRLANVFNYGTAHDEIKDGCDIAALFIDKLGGVRISSGNMRVFVCDGSSVTQLRGQKLFIGEGELKAKKDVDTITIPANTENKFYVASDGLYEQIGGENDLPFGYKSVMSLIIDNHKESQDFISEEIWRAFEEYRGETAQADDFELITFKVRSNN